MSSNYKKQDGVKKELPDIIVDPNTGKAYNRGSFLGKGGFAKCYELTNPRSKEIYAGKIVPKSLLKKQHQKEKMSQEIAIHRRLSHKHIVQFFNFFEDSDNVYVILELCRRRSLMELHKRRKALTEPETRYFLRHLLNGVKYLHDHKIIHRDLKLGNLFLNDEMEVKIGDFGLATRVDFDGERKKTLCGTPNYIAPEILTKRGHSYEVDIWSIGCILFTLLVGKPPFETDSLQETYSRIKENKYHVPSRIAALAKCLIQNLLQEDPARRPAVDAILNDDFMTLGYIPSRLPTSCLTMAPRFGEHLNNTLLARKPLLPINTKDGSPAKTGSNKDGTAKKPISGRENAPSTRSAVPSTATGSQPPTTTKTAAVASAPSETPAEAPRQQEDKPDDCHLSELYKQVSGVVNSKPDERNVNNEDEAEQPSAAPMIWVSKWVDYSDKYGLGYQLSDDSIGVFYNDYTKLVLQPDGENIHYIERNGKEHYHQLSNYPENMLYKKVTLLRYFRNYMHEHLLKAGAAMEPREGDELSRIPSLKTYFRTRSAIILHLSNGTLQINFFDDHTKIILCPLMGAVTYIDNKREFRTFKLDLISKYGCSPEIATRLRYARNMIQKLMLSKSYSSKTSSKGSNPTPVSKPQPAING